ncbi:L,D-transpeptidase family protein [Microbacterium sp. BWT-B31]|uniref:L,D-transpeptidase family protein n=1 Tax=Microbacterium sp. BWT-B31 TaxID=3232072 RepID=UPI003528F64F
MTDLATKTGTFELPDDDTEVQDVANESSDDADVVAPEDDSVDAAAPEEEPTDSAPDDDPAAAEDLADTDASAEVDETATPQALTEVEDSLAVEEPAEVDASAEPQEPVEVEASLAAEEPAEVEQPADPEDLIETPTEPVTPSAPVESALQTAPADPDAATAALGAASVTQSAPGAPANPPDVRWAPSEPAPRKSRKGLWIGIGAGVAAAALVAASLVLIAPGTSIAGVPVGGLTPGAAADAVSARLAETTLVLTGAGEGAELTAAELGASVNARELANEAFGAHPAWNPTTWFPAPHKAVVQVDADAATAALRHALPSLYTDPTDAELTFDAATASYTVTPAIPGVGIDVDAVRAALQEAFDAGKATVAFDPVESEVDASTPTSVATATAARLNAVLDTAGFYVGEERTVPLDRATVASWITLGDGPRGTFSIDVDEKAIQAVVDTLPAAVDRPAVNATVITNSDGDVLSSVTSGVEGRTLGSTDDIASGFAEQIANANGVYQLPVTATAFTTTSLARSVEVNLSEQRVYAIENGVVVASSYVSSGLPGNDTPTGHFQIFAKLDSQNMGNRDTTKAPYYFTENVPNVMYFDGDVALHGAYWHNNFGNRMSHGCVNLPLDVAAFLFTWAEIGTDVWVHY